MRADVDQGGRPAPTRTVEKLAVALHGMTSTHGATAYDGFS